MFCTVCGKKIPEGSKFCPECGTAAPTSKFEARPVSDQDTYNTQYNPGNYQQNGYQNTNAQQSGYQSNADRGYQPSGQQNGGYGQNTGYQQPQPYYPQQPYRDPYDAPNAGFLVLGLFFPIVGLILYLVMKDQSPLKAKSAGKGAIIGVCIWAGIVLLTFILIAVFAATFAGAASYYYW